MHEMPRIGHDVQLVLALHLGDGQGLVEAVGARQDEQLGGGRGEELRGQGGEPCFPEGLGGGQVGGPGVEGGGGGGGVGRGVDEARDGDGGGGRVAEGVGGQVPVDGGGEGGEGFGPGGEVGCHRTEGVEGAAFDDVEDDVGLDFEGWVDVGGCVGGDVGYDRAAEGVAD